MPKSKHQIPGRVRSTYAFIKAHRDRHSVEMMCRVLEVAPSGYYDWLKHPISNRAQEDARLLRLIRASFVASHGIYGSVRVFLDLREAGETCSKHRVARLMRENNLRALHGYRIRRWAAGTPSVLIPNLLQRQFTATRPNTAWVTDITYIRTWQGWLYLAVVLDLFSRLIVGWATAPTIHRELVLNAVLMAVRRPPTARHADSFRSGHPVRQRRVAALLPLESPGAEYEPQGQLLGQCRRRIVLQRLEERTDQETDLQEPRSGDRGRRSIHRLVLQFKAPSQSSRRRQPGAIRGRS